MTEKWQKIKGQKVYDGYLKIVKETWQLPDGTTHDYDIKDQGYAHVCVLAITKDKKIIIAKQFRPGPQKLLWDLPGGDVDKGEDPIEAAARELLEETGYKGKLVQVGQNYTCAYSTVLKLSFVATECEKVAELQSSKGEYKEVELIPLDQLREKLSEGLVTDVNTVYYGLEYLKSEGLI